MPFRNFHSDLKIFYTYYEQNKQLKKLGVGRGSVLKYYN